MMELQRLIKDMCPSSPVPFVHCASHNLNLVINDAVKSIPQNETFFTILQDVSIFLGAQIERERFSYPEKALHDSAVFEN